MLTHFCLEFVSQDKVIAKVRVKLFPKFNSFLLIISWYHDDILCKYARVHGSGLCCSSFSSVLLLYLWLVRIHADLDGAENHFSSKANLESNTLKTTTV